MASSRGFQRTPTPVEAVEQDRNASTDRSSDNYALRLSAALEAITAAQRTHESPSSAAAGASAPTRPAAATASRGFGNARAAAGAAYQRPVLDLASDEDARPAPLAAREREIFAQPPVAAREVTPARSAVRAQRGMRPTAEAQVLTHAAALPEQAGLPALAETAEAADAPGADQAQQGQQAQQVVAAGAPKRGRVRTAKPRLAAPAPAAAADSVSAGADAPAPVAARALADAAGSVSAGADAPALVAAPAPVAAAGSAPVVRRGRSRRRADAAPSVNAALDASTLAAAPEPSAATPSTPGQPRFGKAYAAAAAMPALDHDDADDDADALDFSAFPEVTEFGTPSELREASTPTAHSRPGADASSATHVPDGATRGFGGFLAALDKLPPIRLPIGPAIPWRFGLPALVAVLAVMLVLNRPTAHAETQGVRLPASETYAVQQEAPLFQKNADAQTTQPAQTTPSGQAAQTAQTAPVGAPDGGPTGGADFVDIMLKMVAVLALAYGSLSLLKRAGVGGAGAATASARPGAPGSNVRVVTSLALAPNRSVHVLQVAGGKTLLLGATPTQVNLLADLGDINLDHPAAEANFLDILTSKLGR